MFIFCNIYFTLDISMNAEMNLQKLNWLRFSFIGRILFHSFMPSRIAMFLSH